MPSATFTPTSADLVDANQLWFTNNLKSSRQYLAYAFGGAFFAALAVWLAYPELVGALALTAAAAAGVVFWTILLAGILGLNYLLLPRKAHRIFAQHKALHAVTHVRWNEEGIVFETEHGHSRHFWTDFVDMAENETLVLLFQSENLFNFVPKRALSTADAAELASRGAQRLRDRAANAQ